jgi:hypothetical protein
MGSCHADHGCDSFFAHRPSADVQSLIHAIHDFNNQAPATDLGYLLHKNPSRVHRFGLSFGKGTVFYA